MCHTWHVGNNSFGMMKIVHQLQKLHNPQTQFYALGITNKYKQTCRQGLQKHTQNKETLNFTNDWGNNT